MVNERLLKELARRALGTVKTVHIGLGVPLVYVMESTRGNIYTVINDQFEALLEELTRSGDTVMVQALAMFAPGDDVDIPSYRFRKALLELDPKNAKAEIIMQGRIMTLEATMPSKK